MKKAIVIIYLMVQSCLLWSQTLIKGTVRSENNQVLAGANVYLKGTLEGATSSEKGTFQFSTGLTGSKILVVSFLGYNTYELPVNLNLKEVVLAIILTEHQIELNDVVIQAGQFEAGDKKKSVVLNRLDMATTSNGFGDAFGAVNSLPGVSNATNEGGLMVRGGEKYETKTFIDGLLVESPYTAKLPNVPVRGRFSPMLFKETVFSTGGYSAEFGQALSSALVLNSIDFFQKDETNVSVYFSGVSFNKIKIWPRNSFSSTTQYNNMEPFFRLIKSNIQWNRAPQSFNQTLVFRQKLGESGVLKVMVNYSHDNSSMFYNNLDSARNDHIALKNNDFFMVTSYKGDLGDDWVFHCGLTYNYDDEPMDIDNYTIRNQKQSGEFRLKFTKSFNSSFSIKIGGNTCIKEYSRDFIPSWSELQYRWNYKNLLSAAFAEMDLKLARRVSTRIGLRGEANLLTNETNIFPRLSLAFKTSVNGQISMAYGEFKQQPADEYLIYNHELHSEQAQHYIVNYQYIKSSRIFRIEAYFKQYAGLIKYDSLYAVLPEAYNNNGNGYARGIDVFFRDNKTIPNGNFWISYSLMDSKRNYKDYSYSHTPWFIARHNLSLVYKHYIKKTDSYISLGYEYASGRPYIDPNINRITQNYTKPYSSLNVSLFHFTKLFGKFTMIFAQVTNILGSNNVFGYKYANHADSNGIYRSETMVPVTKRFFLIGIHVSFNGKPDV
jgi:hypothetical protein